jgi:hypothetical protein
MFAARNAISFSNNSPAKLDRKSHALLQIGLGGGQVNGLRVFRIVAG